MVEEGLFDGVGCRVFRLADRKGDRFEILGKFGAFQKLAQFGKGIGLKCIKQRVHNNLSFSSEYSQNFSERRSSCRARKLRNADQKKQRPVETGR